MDRFLAEAMREVDELLPDSPRISPRSVWLSLPHSSAPYEIDGYWYSEETRTYVSIADPTVRITVEEAWLAGCR